MRAKESRPARHVITLQRETTVPLERDATFAFFADAGNLERLTPPWLNFRILTPRPIAMEAGTIIDYRVVLYGIPIPWRTRIDVWEPGVRFVDRQLSGPYLWWHHEHAFEQVAGGTRVIDRVDYLPRLRWLSAALVKRDVERIFSFRQEALPQLLRSAAMPPR